MQSQGDQRTETCPRSIDVLPDPSGIGRYFRNFLCRWAVRLFVFAGAITAPGAASAAEPTQMPPGMRGWTYLVKLNEIGYVRTPEEACALNAANHWGTPLRYMRPSEMPKAIFQCFYANPVGGVVHHYGITHLECEAGYAAKASGICSKWTEPARPPSCAADEAGFSTGNPVALSSGAKVQTETDFPGLPSGALRVTRTYRSLRDFGTGQSAGRAWSFSFDRPFSVLVRIFGTKLPYQVTGAFGDGSTFGAGIGTGIIGSLSEDDCKCK